MNGKRNTVNSITINTWVQIVPICTHIGTIKAEDKFELN